MYEWAIRSYKLTWYTVNSLIYTGYNSYIYCRLHPTLQLVHLLNQAGEWLNTASQVYTSPTCTSIHYTLYVQ